MSSTVKHLRSSTADKRPTASGLADGQLGINTASGTPGIFFKDSAGTVVKVGPAHVGSTAPNVVPAGSAGNSRGELWVNNSTTINGLNYYTGSAFVNLTPSGTLTTAGLVELATAAETQAGTDGIRAVTPSGLQSKMSDSTSTASSTTIASSAAVKQAYDLAAAAVAASGTSIITGELLIGSTGSLVFEGSVDDSFETTLAVVNPTADRTITLPNITGTVVTTGDTNTVTGTMIASGTITNTEISASAAIALSKLATGALPTGITVSSGNIVDGTITNADVSASAAIAGTKISPNFGSQNILTTGTATAASLIPTGSGVPTNGVYLPAANSVAISTNGSQRATIDSSGRLLVGASASSINSTVVCEGNSAGSTLGAIVNLQRGQSASDITAESLLGRISFTDNAQNIYAQLDVNTDATSGSGNYPGRFRFLTTASGSSTATERMRINSQGRVGIGTASPATLLHLSSATGSATPTPTELRIATTTNASDWSTTNPWGRISFYSEDTSSTGPKIEAAIDAVAQAATGGISRLDFKTAAVTTGVLQTQMSVDHTGRVGIGTTSPGRLLTVANAVNTDATIKDIAYFCGSYASNAGSGARLLIGGDIASVTNRGVALVGVNTGGSSNAHDMVFEVSPSSAAPTERARIDSSGRLLVGTSTARNTFYNSTTNIPNIQLEATGFTPASIGIVNNGNDTNGSALLLGKERSGSPGGNTLVNDGDSIGRVSFQAGDGTNLVEAASVRAFVDGTPDADDMPGRLVFSVTLDGASTPTEALRITNDRVVAYNQAAPTSKSAAATLTIAELKTGIIQYTGSAATLTLPTGTLSEGGFSGIYTNMAFEWSVINTGSGTCTIGAGTAHTIVGGATIAAGASGRFASRRTAANTFVAYRLS